MSENVEFYDQSSDQDTLYVSRQVLGVPIKPAMINFVKKYKLFKTDEQAYYVLVSISLVSLIIAGFIFAHFVLGVGKKKTTVYKVSPAAQGHVPVEIKNKIQTQSTNK